MEPTIETTATSQRPKEVATAVLLLVLSLVIGGLRAVFDLTGKVSGAAFFVALLILIAFLGVLFFFVSRIAAGRNWARIVLLVLLVLQLPFTVLGSIAEVRANPMHGAVTIVIAVLQLLGAVLLFTKNSNRWFRRN